MTDRLPLLLSAALLAALALLGGASRATEVAQMPLRLVALAVLVAALWSPDRERLTRYRPLFLFLALAAAVPAVQLIPLPPGLWQALPGRGFYADLARQAGLAEVWRPISLAPDLTRHALLSLLVPAAMLVVAARLQPRHLAWFVWAMLGLALASLLLGYAQMAGGPMSALRLYAVTNRDSMTGLFANRNHHALLLAMTLPPLFALAAVARRSAGWGISGPLLAGAGVALAGATLLLIGSRAGLLLGAVGALAGAVLFAAMTGDRPSRRTDAAPARRWRGPAMVVGGVAVVIAGLALVFAQSPAMQRLLRTDPAEEVRSQLFRPTVDLAAAMQPMGGGIGAFDQLFRRFEPDRYLRLSYQNQAHMEPLQVAIEAGLPGVALLALLLWWWFVRTRAAWRMPRPTTLTEALPRLGSILIALPLLASLGDYPLRTPIHAALFAVAAVWLELGARAYPATRRHRG